MTSNASARAARRGVRWLGATVLGGWIATTVVACTFDPDDRCGPHQVVYGNNARCVCEPGAVLTDKGCEPCGAHQVPGTSGCVCEAGYTQAPGATECTETPMGLGDPCDPAHPACNNPKYPLCYAPATGTPYCTSTDCNNDCEGGYACDQAVTPSVCLRPPTGFLKPCKADADCAGTEASYCDTYQSHSCLVQGCTLSPDNCFVGWECCDLSAFGVPQPLCIPDGACAK